ncbi:chlorophyllase [Parasphingopyxis algicola]|uniref:alpha/beta hydrolase family protein n=1 Tax=Parasphingopyxis algicola TaxID=2026624 RepID=UPI00159FFE54|nr:chlorophyllase [Parasphingopyxis algicola]QLC26371.1 chlorophyllase [Parasphingopyxis algicola]
MDENQPIFSFDPIPVTARDLEFPIRVTAPQNQKSLPVLIFSHGAGYGRADYQPLVEVWARGGFLVIQPSHPDQFTTYDDPRFGRFWHDRVMQISGIVDQGDALFDAIPQLADRGDWNRVVAAGHSFGGLSVGNLLGARSFDETTGKACNLKDTRIVAGAMLAPPGCVSLDSEMGKTAPYVHTDYSHMRGPALIVAGKEDDSAHAGRDWTWHSDPYTSDPRDKSLLVLQRAGHYLHGIIAPNRRETGEDEDPEMVENLARAVLSYLRTAIDPDDPAWQEEQERMDTNEFTICSK